MFVSGVLVTLREYTESGADKLIKINQEIEQHIKDNPEQTFGDPELKKLKAKWWKRKGDILWIAEKELKEEFFGSDNFEISLLKKTEDFFLIQGNYL